MYGEWLQGSITSKLTCLGADPLIIVYLVPRHLTAHCTTPDDFRLDVDVSAGLIIFVSGSHRTKISVVIVFIDNFSP